MNGLFARNPSLKEQDPASDRVHKSDPAIAGRGLIRDIWSVRASVKTAYLQDRVTAPKGGNCHINLETQVDKPLFISRAIERTWVLESKWGFCDLE